MTPAAIRLVLVAGNDLPAGFYAPLSRELEQRGLTLDVVELGAASWRATLGEIEQRLPAHLLLGHSLGAYGALLAGAAAPDAVRGLVLLEPAIMPGRRSAQFVARRYARRVTLGERRRFENDTGLHRRVARLDAFPVQAVRAYLDRRSSIDPQVALGLLDELPGLYPLPRPPLPALVVRGARTGLMARWLAGRLARRLDAAVHDVPDAAHWLANEADAAVAGVLAGFADRLPRVPVPAQM